MFFSYRAESELTAEEAISVLGKNVSSRRWFDAPKTIFEGRVVGPRFWISYAVHSIDTFNPLIRGYVLPRGAGCIVRVVMRPHPVTVIFMAAWSLLLALWAAMHGRMLPVAWIVILIPLLLGIGGFIYSVPHNKRILKQCLKLRFPEEERANNSPEATPGEHPPARSSPSAGAPHLYPIGNKIHRLFLTWILAVVVAVAVAATTKDLPGWHAKPEQSSVPIGIYVSVAMGFSQTVELRVDGSFESQFAGETHKSGEGARWTEFSFAGKWSINGGRIVFRYFYKGEERIDMFSIGEWDSKPAFMFSRPADGRCPFVAELFALDAKKPNQSPQATTTVVTSPAAREPRPL